MRREKRVMNVKRKFMASSIPQVSDICDALDFIVEIDRETAFVGGLSLV